eukprot:10668915-Heterocapsa_arctica.AAC.1
MTTLSSSPCSRCPRSASGWAQSRHRSSPAGPPTRWTPSRSRRAFSGGPGASAPFAASPQAATPPPCIPL